jgi:demethylmenaquinone methyltransferase / 2-methoxy-6-polyprenyl-1,4-benzoquinol methylase
MVRERATEVDGAAMQGRDRELYVAGMFDRIAAPYDRLNGLISLGRDRRWRETAIELAGVAPGSTVVDLGCGTGDFILAALPKLAGRGRVFGIDLSPNMIDIARLKVASARSEVPIELRTGNAESTGLSDACADVVTMGWVVRNLGDRPKAYAEILRVLKPGGRFVSLEVSRPESALARAGFSVYLRAVMPVMIGLTGGDRGAYRYLADSTERFLGPRELAAELESAGFRDVSFRPLMGGAMAIHRAVKP